MTDLDRAMAETLALITERDGDRVDVTPVRGHGVLLDVYEGPPYPAVHCAHLRLSTAEALQLAKALQNAAKH